MALTADDVKALSALTTLASPSITDLVPIYRPGSSTVLQNATLSAIGTALGVTTGTVTSVAVASANGDLTVSGSPVTNSGTITLTVVSAPKWDTARTLTYTGDVTGTLSIDGSANASGALTIAANAVTYAKMQQSSQASILIGRDNASAGNLEEITLGSGLAMIGTVLTVVPAVTPEIDYAYLPSDLGKSTGGAGSQTSLLGAGNGMTDVAGSVWSISVGTYLLTGACDTTDGNQFLRDQLTFPSASTPAGLAQTIVFDLDATSVATVYAMFRRAGATSAYFVGAANAGTNAGRAYIKAYSSGSQTASASGSITGYVSSHTLRVTAQVSGASPTTISCVVKDLNTGQIVSACMLSDSTSGLQTATAGGLAVTNNAGANVSQSCQIQQILAYDPTVSAKSNYIAFIGDSLTYGEHVSDTNANGGTIVGNNPAAQTVTNLGGTWGGANLGNQASRIDQINSNIAPKLSQLLASRQNQWAIVMAGINDAGQGDTAGTIETRMTTLCASVRAAGYKVMVSTIIPVGSGCTVYNSFGTTASSINSVVSTVNTWIRTNWQSFADGFVDPASNSNLSSYSSTYFYSDQLHLNDTGSALVGTLWAAAVQARVSPGLIIEGGGTVTTPSARSLNFTGSGVTVSDDGAGNETVTIAGAAGGSWTLISEQTPSGVGSVTFSSISASYRDLKVIVRGQTSESASFSTMLMQFNSDTGANYDYEVITMNNATNTSVGSVAQTSAEIGFLVGASGVANAASVCEAIIYDYRGTTFHKSYLSRSGVRVGTGAGNMYALDIWGDWRSTSAINAIKVLPLNASNFQSGSVVSLYGST